MTPVKSSNIHAVDHNPSTQDLEVHFHKQGVVTGKYMHSGVPAEVHASFMAADSPGKFYAANIKGKYPHTRLPADPATVKAATE